MSKRTGSKRPVDGPTTAGGGATVAKLPVGKPSAGDATRWVGHADRAERKSALRELSWAEFDEMVQRLAQVIRRKYEPTAVVGVAHGGVFVGGVLASALKADFFPVRISRRSRDRIVRKVPRMSGEMPRELAGRRVLVVDDVAASGETLELAVSLAKRVGAKEVRTAALLARKDGYAPDWAGLTTLSFFVFPWDYSAVQEDARFDVDPDKAGA